MTCVETFTINDKVKKAGNINDIIVCCCAKNEQRYIEKWCKYYFKLGFDKIYIGNNDNNQLSLPLLINLSTILTSTEKRKIIIQNLRHETSFQAILYDKYANELIFNWALFIDCDEYLELHQHNNIREYINDFPINANAILINWLCYGTCNNKRYKSGNIMEIFPCPKLPIDESNENAKSLVHSNNTNKHVKTLLKKQRIKVQFTTPHATDVAYQYTNNFKEPLITHDPFPALEAWQPINYDYATLHHYYTKSAEEFNNKIKSRPDYVVGTNDKVDIERLKTYKYLNTNNLPTTILMLCNRPEDKKTVKYKNILCFNKDKLSNLLKNGKIVTYVGDLDNNNLFINIAYNNGCKYIYKLPKYFHGNVKDYDYVIK